MDRTLSWFSGKKIQLGKGKKVFSESFTKIEWVCVALLEFQILPPVVQIGKIECSVHLYSSPWPRILPLKIEDDVEGLLGVFPGLICARLSFLCICNVFRLERYKIAIYTKAGYLESWVFLDRSETLSVWMIRKYLISNNSEIRRTRTSCHLGWVLTNDCFGQISVMNFENTGWSGTILCQILATFSDQFLRTYLIIKKVVK